ncbi:hypothetical protein B0H16DRAFT_756493 [Mycena metata]|uniref:MYND-type domain-containing protein n=1 Tax=Mycena metata TaxID=1033252 RepID=A0AAD7IZV9_9AGAR|nr:hypothetical protein B0H16DRAFT_756493 [Mycena metata]
MVRFEEHPLRALLDPTLRDPLHQDSLCIRAIFFIIVSIVQDGGGDFEQPSFLRRILDFICAASEDEHLARRERLMTCRCNLRRTIILEIHRSLDVEATAIKSLDLTLFVLCKPLSAGLDKTTPGKFRKHKEGVLPDSQPWPSDITDILPHGKNPSDVLDAILLWAVEPGHGQIFALIDSLARFWEPFAVALFQRPSVFALATQHLEHAIDTFPGGAVGTNRLKNWVQSVNGITAFFHKVSLVDAWGSLTFIKPLLDQMNSIEARMSPILDRLGPAVMEETSEWFALCHRLAMTIATEHHPTPLPDRGQYDGLYVAAFKQIWEARNRNRCMHPGCAGSIESRSAVCARCGVVRYCSRECQRASWKGEHKLLCGQIYALRVGLKMTDATSWEALVLDTKFARSTVQLMDVVQPHAPYIDINLITAIISDFMELSRELGANNN